MQVSESRLLRVAKKSRIIGSMHHCPRGISNGPFGLEQSHAHLRQHKDLQVESELCTDHYLNVVELTWPNMLGLAAKV